MKRPWHVWSLFAAVIAIVAPAMGWLTYKAIELDQAEALARQQAELEEDVSRALWRLDAMLTPLLAQEAARPDFVYRPLYATNNPGKGKGPSQSQAVSPLLLQPPDYVIVNFELQPDDKLSSPQSPQGPIREIAIENGAAVEQIEHAEQALDQLRGALSHDQLVAELPDASLPLPNVDPSIYTANVTLAPQEGNSIVANTYAVPSQQLAMQLDAQSQTTQESPPQVQANGAVLDIGPQQANTVNPQSFESPYSQQAVPQQAASKPTNSRMQQRVQNRASNDLESRDAAYQAYASKVLGQRQTLAEVASAPTVIEGVSRPLWVDGRLILARRVKTGTATVIQGCWLDWPKLRERMQQEIADVLPEASLTPVAGDELPRHARLLATLPVQLSAPAPVAEVTTFSPIRISLLIAWGCLLAAALAAAATLTSVVALSERRAAFVAAVTHELRTPLTTFRMYAEMLAEGMAPPASRQQYLETLRVEADRLHHLVENVLQYSQLERGRPGKHREKIELGALIDRLESRLADRAKQAGLKLLVEVAQADRIVPVTVDVGAVEQILFNLVDNASKYAVAADDHRLHLRASVAADWLRMQVQDHGPGISRAGQQNLFQPFSKSVHEAACTAPGVGLGLALCRRLAKHLGGSLQLLPSAEGATFELRLPR